MKKTDEKKYRVTRGVENDKGRFGSGQEVTEAELLAVFPADTVRLWILRGILEEVTA